MVLILLIVHYVAGGVAEFISPGERMEAKVMRIMARALQPTFTNVSIDWGAVAPFVVRAAPTITLPLFDGGRTLLCVRECPCARAHNLV